MAERSGFKFGIHQLCGFGGITGPPQASVFSFRSRNQQHQPSRAVVESEKEMPIMCLNTMAGILLGFMLISLPPCLSAKWQSWNSKAGSWAPNQGLCRSVMRTVLSCSSTTVVTESNQLKLSHSYLCTGKTLSIVLYIYAQM